MKNFKLSLLTSPSHPTMVLILTFLTGFLFFGILLILTQRLAGSDDTAFPVYITHFPTISDWLVNRYETWSGRIFSEAFVYIFSPLPLYFWKMVTLALYALSSIYLYLFYKLLSKNGPIQNDYFMATAALMFPYLMNLDVLLQGTFWVTGAMNYFWITSFGLMALYPVAYYVVRNTRPRLSVTVIGFISIIIAASSQEQVGAIILALVIGLTALRCFHSLREKNRRIPYYLLGFSIATLIAFFTGFFAPGNRERVASETATWLPDFYTTPLIQHAEYGYRWWLEALINHTGLLMVGAWLMMIFLYIKMHKDSKLHHAIFILLSAATLCFITKGFDALYYWFTFYPTWKPGPLDKLSYVVLLLWGIILLLSMIAPLLIYGMRARGWLISILFGAVLASTAIVLLSPTVYASGWRTLHVPSFTLLFICYLLLADILKSYRKYQYFILGTIALFAFSNYIHIAHSLIQQ